MKVLHLSGARIWGGNEQQLVALIPELEKLGVKNTVLGISGSVLHSRCIEKKIDFIAAKKNKLNKFANYLYLKKVVKQLQPDVIHMHTSDSLTVFTISDLLTSLKTKAVFSKKGMGSRSSMLSKFKYNYKNIARIICVSNRVKQDFSKILTLNTQKKLVVVHDCVAADVNREFPADENLREKFKLGSNTFIVGNIANHTAAKDLQTLIDVADHIVNIEGDKNIAFIQIGDFTKITDELKQKVKEKSIEQHVFFTGKLPDAYRYNSQFDVFLMTSEREGGPTSVLEAMHMGTPVVSTNVGVIPDAIIDGESGFIANVKDYKSLAEKIGILIKDEKKREQFSLNAVKIIKDNFTCSTIAKQTLQVYKEAGIK